MALSLGLSLCAAQEDKRYEIPWDQLSESRKKKVKKVMDDVTVTVPLERGEVASRREYYDFLLDELPFTSDVCRALGRAKYEVFRDPKVPEKKEEKEEWRRTYYLNDKDGLKIKVELIHSEENRRIFYTWGSYDLDPFPAVWGRSVIVVLWEEKGGKLLTEAKVYAQVHSSFYKALSDVFKGTIESTVKEKSAIFIEAARWVSENAAANPQKLYEQVKGSKEVDQDVLELFRKKFLDK